MFEQFIDKLQNDTFLTLETTPGHSPLCNEIIDYLEELNLHNLVDGFSTTDSPLSKLKLNSLFAAVALQQRLKKPVIATMSMRDRNSIALQSDLLGANGFDVRAILALTGDSVKMSDQPNPKAVVEGDSTLLLKIIKHLNEGIDLAGKEFKKRPAAIYPFAVSPSDVTKKESLLKKMIKKLDGGAIGIITQPIFNKDDIEPLIEVFQKAKQQTQRQDAQLIIGSFPVVRFKTANFLHNKVPGANVPLKWLELLENSDDEYKTGFELSLEVFQQIRQKHGKCHLMAANNFALAKELIES